MSDAIAPKKEDETFHCSLDLHVATLVESLRAFWHMNHVRQPATQSTPLYVTVTRSV